MVKKPEPSRPLRPAYAAWLALLLGLLAGCSEETASRTELLLVADTDVPPPAEIRFEIFGPEGPAERTEFADSGYADLTQLPRTLALVHTKGPLGPFTVSASIDTEGATLTRTHVVYFVHGKTKLVPLHLRQACLQSRCEAGQECDENLQCIAQPLDALMDYSGAPERVFGDDATSRMDAGQPAADGGAPDAAQPDDAGGASDAGDDAGSRLQVCGGQTVDTQSNDQHCGKCDAPCNNKRTCVSGQCKK